MTGEAATHCTFGKARGRRPMDTRLVTLLLGLVLNFETHHDCAYCSLHLHVLGAGSLCRKPLEISRPSNFN